MTVEMPINLKELLAEASKQVVAISASEALGLVESEDHVFIDLREDCEIKQTGKILGAHLIARGRLESAIDPNSKSHDPIFAENKMFVFYCASGVRSLLGAKTALDMGLPSVCHVEGGIRAWQQASGPREMVSQ